MNMTSVSRTPILSIRNHITAKVKLNRTRLIYSPIRKINMGLGSCRVLQGARMSSLNQSIKFLTSLKVLVVTE